jgi:hypothetical protein
VALCTERRVMSAVFVRMAERYVLVDGAPASGRAFPACSPFAGE